LPVENVLFTFPELVLCPRRRRLISSGFTDLLGIIIIRCIATAAEEKMMTPPTHTQPVLQRISLRALKVGQAAVVTAVQHRIPAVRQKYLARGIVPGAHVMLLHHGDPVVVALEESRWAIAGDEADHIEVALVGGATARSWWRQLLRLVRNGFTGH
jgi:Fe2+ transport system protein FeoA